MAQTEAVTLAKALSIKNRLAGRLAQARTNIEAYNSVLEGQRDETLQTSIDVRAEFERFKGLQSALIAVKAAIQQANAPILEDILRLGEVKSLIQMLSTLNTKQGPEPGYNGVEYRYVATFHKPEVLELVKRAEAEIDTIQDRINQHNAATRIELAEDVLILSR